MGTALDRVHSIAQVAHEANRAYCLTLGDTSQLPWYDAPDWQRESAIKGVAFHLAEHAAGRTPSPSASHDSWLAEKRAAGWTYGPVKNPDAKQHPCFVPYDELPLEQQKKDALFGAIVNALR